MNDYPGRRRLVLVVGAGRSGTSLTAGVFSQLGFHVPQPEVAANFTNPRGFGEPRWVVDFHAHLMREQHIGLFDARPAAWDAAREAAATPDARARLLSWLRQEFGAHDRIVVKDPRTVWFLPLWHRCADELDVDVHYVTTLRHPTEVLRSIRTTAGDQQTEATRTAWWISTMVNTERATRGRQRAYVRYEELLADWRHQLSRVEVLAHLPVFSAADDTMLAAVDDFVDPTLRRSEAGWADVEVPPSVQRLAERVWDAVSILAGEATDDTVLVSERLDGLRAEYELLYAEAEAIADSSATHAARVARAAAAATPPPSAFTRLKRRLPPNVRKRLGRAKRAVTGARGAADGAAR